MYKMQYQPELVEGGSLKLKTIFSSYRFSVFMVKKAIVQMSQKLSLHQPERFTLCCLAGIIISHSFI